MAGIKPKPGDAGLFIGFVLPSICEGDMMRKHTQRGIAHMTKIQSVDRDKFVVRFDQEGTRHAVEVDAAKVHISMNAWIQQAIDEKLARGARMDRLMDAAERGLI